MTTPSLLILVPARGGSKRLPGKNLKYLGDRPLLAHTADAVAASGLQEPVVLSTDDAAIAEAGRRLGMLVPFVRPAALADDAAPTEAAVLHALDWCVEMHGTDPDAVMVLQPTSPFRGGGILRAAVDALAERADVDSIIGMTAIHLPADKIYFATRAGVAEPVNDAPRRPLYQPNGAVYLTRTSAFRRDKTLYAGTILPLVTDPLRALDIDTQEDWRLAEALLAAGLPPEQHAFSADPSITESAP